MAKTRVQLKVIATCLPVIDVNAPHDGWVTYVPGPKHYTLIDGDNVYDLTKEQCDLLFNVVSDQKLEGEAKEERLRIIDECS